MTAKGILPPYELKELFRVNIPLKELVQMSAVSRKALIDWLEAMRDGYEHSPLTVDQGKHHAYNITINRINSGRFNLSESEGEAFWRMQYEQERDLCRGQKDYLRAENERLRTALMAVRKLVAWRSDQLSDKIWFLINPTLSSSSTSETAVQPIADAKLEVAMKWLEDIRKVGSATSMLATAAIFEIQAIDDQYPLGIKDGRDIE